MVEKDVHADLLEKVKSLLREVEAQAEAKLRKIQASGAGVLQDHDSNGQNLTTPRDFVVALLQDYADAVVPGRSMSKQRRHTINQYNIHM